jgi:DNA invertase Pin-like site-specific DNA recombinase
VRLAQCKEGAKVMSVYGYCRISRKTQNIDRQVRNILAAYPTAHIVKEAYTGTKIAGRKELDKLLKVLKSRDTVVFDSASRMSRNADEAIALYEDLFSKGVELVFLKEPHINSQTYKKALENQIQISSATGNEATDKFIDSIIKALNSYTMDLATEQIKLVFEQAEKEVTDLRMRTSEGILTAKLNGKRIGQPQGAKLTTKKSIAAKEIIKKHNKDFNGSLNDEETRKLAGIARNSYYKYKRELREELAAE